MDSIINLEYKKRKIDNSLWVESTNENKYTQNIVYEVDMSDYEFYMVGYTILVLNSEYKKFINTPLIEKYMKINYEWCYIPPSEEEVNNILLNSIKEENNIFSYYFLGTNYLNKYSRTGKKEDLDNSLSYLNVALEKGFISVLLELSICFLGLNNIIEFDKYFQQFKKYILMIDKNIICSILHMICNELSKLNKKNHNIYNECVKFLHESKYPKYSFYYSIIYKHSEPYRYLKILREGIKNNCIYCCNEYGQYILISKYLNKNFEFNYLAKTEIEYCINLLEKVCKYELTCQKTKIDIYKKIASTYLTCKNNLYANIYLDKLLNDYNCVQSGLKLIKYYDNLQNFNKSLIYYVKLANLDNINSIIYLIKYYDNIQNQTESLKYETKLTELNINESIYIKDLINYYISKKNYIKCEEYLEIIKYLDKKYYDEIFETFKLFIERNNLKIKSYPEKDFECHISSNKLSSSVILSCCSKDIGYWFLFPTPEKKCPFCRHVFF
jgi:hypothetical protein